MARQAQNMVGNPMSREITLSLEEAKEYLLKRVTFEPNTGCWLWVEGWDRAGYAQLTFNRKVTKGHRLSYRAFKGDFDTSLFICHKCDTPCCINPEHLFPGTARENNLDQMRKGRNVTQNSKREHLFLRGKRYNSKLSNEDIPIIRSRRKRGDTLSSIARDYGCSIPAISAAITGKTWGHIT